MQFRHSSGKFAARIRRMGAMFAGSYLVLFPNAELIISFSRKSDSIAQYVIRKIRNCVMYSKKSSPDNLRFSSRSIPSVRRNTARTRCAKKAPHWQRRTSYIQKAAIARTDFLRDRTSYPKHSIKRTSSRGTR